MLITKIKNWLLPAVCVLCSDNTQQDIDLCVACEKDLPWLQQVCVTCALPLSATTIERHQCGDCLQRNLPYQQILALFQYGTPIDRFITGLKFHQKLVYAKLLGELLARRLAAHYRTEKLPEYIIPMPLHHIRLRERGFNQAVEIAKTVANRLELKMNLQSCQRSRATVAQTSLPAAQRKNNVKNAFYISSQLRAKHIAILDDVVTTGHTITELSRELNNAGVERIDVWCCARTMLPGD